MITAQPWESRPLVGFAPSMAPNLSALRNPISHFLDGADPIPLRTLHNRLIDDFMADSESLNVYLLLNELYAQTISDAPVTGRINNKIEIASAARLARTDGAETRFSRDFSRASKADQLEILTMCARRYFSIQQIPIIHRQLQYHRPCTAEVKSTSNTFESIFTIGYLDTIYPFSLLIAPLPAAPQRYEIPMSVVSQVTLAIRQYRLYI